jgi:hypothetical protein
MKINYEKSDLITMGTSEEDSNNYARLFAITMGLFLLNNKRRHSTNSW